MAVPLYDRVLETTTTTGTGTLTLAGAVTGYQSFAAVGNTNICSFVVYDVDANGNPSGSWEVSEGAYTASGTTLARTKILSSSNSGSAVNFAAGTKRVALVAPAAILGQNTGLCQGRLTLTSGTPVTTADVTGATTVYFTPYLGNSVALYNGTGWQHYQFSEVSLALGTLTSGLPYDVFLYDNAGTLTLELLAWTNGTTRATALVLQDGVLSKTGALTRRYLGTFYTTSTTQTEDSAAKRFLWNMYNRLPRQMRVLEATSTWTYNSATWHSANASNANRLQVVVGQPDAAIHVEVHGIAQAVSSADHGAAIGEDSTSSPHANCVGRYSVYSGGNCYAQAITFLDTYVAVGFHYYQWLERVSGAVTLTFVGTNGDDYHQAGIGGTIFG